MSHDVTEGHRAGPPVVFLVGAPRSGTTWLQRLLGGAPEIGTPQETQLFDGYISAWWQLWRRQLPEDAQAWQAARHRGLPAVLTEDEFQALLTTLVDRVYGNVLAAKPGSTIVLDKNPDNALQIDLLLRVCPGARVLHILRDGRDVAQSLMSARRGWGRGWAPRNAYVAGGEWARYVASARSAEGRAPYLETRYEDLQAKGVDELQRCLAFCGVDADTDRLQALLDAESLSRRKEQHATRASPPDSIVWGGEVVARLGGPPPEPAGFFGEGGSGSWASSWSPYERWSFERAAGSTLLAAGYPQDELVQGLSAVQRRAFAARLSAWEVARDAYRSASGTGASSLRSG